MSRSFGFVRSKHRVENQLIVIGASLSEPYGKLRDASRIVPHATVRIKPIGTGVGQRLPAKFRPCEEIRRKGRSICGDDSFRKKVPSFQLVCRPRIPDAGYRMRDAAGIYFRNNQNGQGVFRHRMLPGQGGKRANCVPSLADLRSGFRWQRACGKCRKHAYDGHDNKQFHQ